MDLPLDTVLAIAVAAYFAGGVLKGAMGFGLPTLGIPILAVTHSLPTALSVAILPTLVSNLAQLWTFRAERHLRFLPAFLGAGAIGLIVGGLALSRIDDAWIEILLGTMVLLYLASRLRPSGTTLIGQERWAPVAGLLAGMVHGSTGLSGLVGPPYMHALGLARPAFVFAVGAMFTLFALMQAPVMAAFGVFDPRALWIGLFVVPAALAGLRLGGILGARMQSATFSRAVLTVLAMTAILPIVNGLAEIAARH